MLLTNLPLARSVMAMLASSLLLMMSVLLTPAATAVTGAVCALEEKGRLALAELAEIPLGIRLT